MTVQTRTEASVVVLATVYTKMSSAFSAARTVTTSTFEQQESSGLSSLAGSSLELPESLPRLPYRLRVRVLWA